MKDQDDFEFKELIDNGRIASTEIALSKFIFYGILCCLSKSEDINNRQHKWLAATIAAQGRV
ncbi:MAG: hypothetical protein PHX60_06640 [Giesbergeria sp.]|uniref:hypothetical protein n=1 Tax=Giesbergeria sp. TaxID=2818473 RepID=UPI0026032A28|nr:hypothetical protein [Giesbergeria sp.]MDD2609361.1 hypothetical protein [Giesbergeria sp.]